MLTEVYTNNNSGGARGYDRTWRLSAGGGTLTRLSNFFNATIIIIIRLRMPSQVHISTVDIMQITDNANVKKSLSHIGLHSCMV